MKKGIEPRLFNDKGASQYDGFSISWHRNTRYEDQRRIAEGFYPRGPKWIRIGRNIRYLKEDLDKWLDGLINQNNPAWDGDYAFEPDKSNLKNQKPKSNASGGFHRGDQIVDPSNERRILKKIANILREKGAGHLADQTENAALNQLPALVEEIDIGGFHEEATELRKVVSEIFNSVNKWKI